MVCKLQFTLEHPLESLARIRTRYLALIQAQLEGGQPS